MIRSATSRLSFTDRVTGLLDSLHRTSHFFSLFMRTWKGVLTIRSPLSTSPAVRETDGAQSFNPEAAEVSRARRPRTDLQGCHQFCSLALHALPDPVFRLSLPLHSYPLPLLPLCALAPADFSELIKHAISFHTSGPQVISLALKGYCLPQVFEKLLLTLPAQLLFHPWKALPDLFTPSSDVPLH